jgi:hypothetical protein
MDLHTLTEAQFPMLGFGLLAALLAMVIAPRASRIVVRTAEAEPARCLIVGIAGLILLFLLNIINGWLCHTGIWIPAGIVIWILSLTFLFYGGLIGVTYVGGCLFRRIGRPSAGFFPRSALGQLFFAIFNQVPLLNLFTIPLQMIAWLIGLGALVVTGLGRDPQWLSSRLGEASRAWSENDA